MKINIICCILLLLSGCNPHKKEIQRLVKEWQGKEILFPEGLETKIFGRDTFCPELLTTPYKILNFTDTSGCTECQLKLYEWKLLKQQTDSLNLHVSFVFIAWQTAYQDLENLQLINQCDIPIFYDREGQFMKLNRFPQRKGFQTFLLDADNRVVLIGNPLDSKNLRELYLQTLQANRQ